MATSFIDKARITVRAGNGGNGVVSFHREKYVAAGGPDGGDGGRGGSIILQVDDNMSTLMDFRYKRKYAAPSGMDGQGARKSGKDGQDLIIRVPRGTLVRDAASGETIKDMSSGEPYVLCKGGRGGWGNMHFATPTRQVPRFAKAGLPGESHDVLLELKLLADVGLIGFPNVGKSTLLSVVSKAQPKIANYHFTTLYPNLGVVWVDEGVSFVMADIPGIIEGASEGAGLGHDFLRHIDRCRLLVHVVDVSGSEGRDPVERPDTINEELKRYSPELATRPQIVCANKVDIMEDSENLERLRAHVEALGYPLLELSAATHQGTRQLVGKVAEMLATLPPVTVYEPEYVPKPPVVDTSAPLEIRRADDGTWLVEGPWLQRLMGTSTSPTTRAGCGSTSACETPVSSSSWRSGASRTATPSPCTTSNSNTSAERTAAPGHCCPGAVFVLYPFFRRRTRFSVSSWRPSSTRRRLLLTSRDKNCHSPSRTSRSSSFMAFRMAPAERKLSSLRSVSVSAPEAVRTWNRASTNVPRCSTVSPWTHFRRAWSLSWACRVTCRSVTKRSPSTCQEKPSCCKSPSWSLSTTV